MKEVFLNWYNYVINFINSLGMLGAFLGSLLIISESILPFLPLFVFITINFEAFGFIIGFLISWICTILGCLLSYYLVNKYFRNIVIKKIKNINLLNKCLKYVKNLSLGKITIILSIPFTPAFMMNIAAGIANIPLKRYFPALLISKIFLVYFWGLIGTSLIESFRHPKNLIIVALMLLIAYILSLIVKKVFKID